ERAKVVEQAGNSVFRRRDEVGVLRRAAAADPSLRGAELASQVVVGGPFQEGAVNSADVTPGQRPRLPSYRDGRLHGSDVSQNRLGGEILVRLAEGGSREAAVGDGQPFDARRGDRFGAQELPSQSLPGDTPGWPSAQLTHGGGGHLGGVGDLRRDTQGEVGDRIGNERLIVEAAARFASAESLQIRSPMTL